MTDVAGILAQVLASADQISVHIAYDIPFENEYHGRNKIAIFLIFCLP